MTIPTALEPELQESGQCYQRVDDSPECNATPYLEHWRLYCQSWRSWKRAKPLTDALRELAAVVAYAKEEGFIVPSEGVIHCTNIFLERLCNISLRQYAVYPMPDGTIAIDAPNGRGSSVLFICSDESVSCLVNVKGKEHRHEIGPIVAHLPHSFRTFISDALRDLDDQYD